MNRRRTCHFLFIVDALGKELLHGRLLALGMFLLLCLEGLKLGTKLLVLWTKLDGILEIFSGLVEVSHLHVGDSSLVQSFDSFWVNCESQGALLHSIFVVSAVVEGNTQILIKCHLQLLDISVVHLASVKVR